MSFVIVQRLRNGDGRLSSMHSLDLVSALEAHRKLSASFDEPLLRFEIVPVTRSIRRRLDELPEINVKLPNEVKLPNAEKFAGHLALKLGKTFAAAFLKSFKKGP